MGKEATTAKRLSPKAALFFGLFILLFAVLPTLQTVAAGYLLGTDHEFFIHRLWTTAILWLAIVSVVLLMVPTFAPLDRKLLVRVRLGSAPITVTGLTILVWVAGTGGMPSPVLPLGLFIGLTPWISTFVIERMGAKKASGVSADSSTGDVEQDA